MSKICKTGKESKSLDKFYSHDSCKSGTRTECKDCGRSKDAAIAYLKESLDG
jgi:hypothetical protein